MSTGEKKPPGLDIAALLRLALDETPSEGFTDRVMNQLAGARTAVELSRLVAVSPFDWLRDEDEDAEDEDEDEDEYAADEDEGAADEDEGAADQDAELAQGEDTDDDD